MNNCSFGGLNRKFFRMSVIKYFILKKNSGKNEKKGC